MRRLISLGFALLVLGGFGCRDAKPKDGIERLRLFIGPRAAYPIVAPHLPKDPVILEGGAYDGKNSVRLAELWPAGTVHCFEPVPELFAKVKATVAGRSNIHPWDLALSDTSGTATFHIAEEEQKPGIPSQSGSLLAPKDHLQRAPSIVFKRTIDVATTTIDDWAARNGIARVDFLFLDIQGAELLAMKGAPRIMKTVKAIVTEVEFVEAYAGQPRYREIRNWLEAQGFRMAAADFDPVNPVRPEGSKVENGRWYGDAVFVR